MCYSNNPKGWYCYYSHFVDEKTETQRSRAACHKSHSRKVEKEFKPGSLN